MRFILGFLSTYLVVIGAICFNNFIYAPLKGGFYSFDIFHYTFQNFLRELPAIIIFGSFILLPCSLIGELIYHLIKKRSLLFGVITYGILGGLIATYMTFSSFILLVTVTGSIIFYIVRSNKQIISFHKNSSCCLCLIK